MDFPKANAECGRDYSVQECYSSTSMGTLQQVVMSPDQLGLHSFITQDWLDPSSQILLGNAALQACIDCQIMREAHENMSW